MASANEYAEYDDRVHDARLQRTRQELLEKVREHELALKNLHVSVAASFPDPRLRATASFEIMKVAYDGLAAQTPYLPFPESVLPALIALQRTQRTVEETRTYLATHKEAVEEARRRLEVERANLRDQEALSQSLQNRIRELRDGLENRMEMGPEDIAREHISELEQKKRNYDRETPKLLKALRSFIEQYLAGMLAAEELGGPVVGDTMDIEEDLAAGFSSQGRPKKTNSKMDDGKRQRRIDEIWGTAEAGDRPQHANNDGRDEIVAAGAEMRGLTEELLNKLIKSDGDSSAAYVRIHRESAAARFLVRSKVAQFHPKDSTKLRLIDFGRELDD